VDGWFCVFGWPLVVFGSLGFAQARFAKKNSRYSVRLYGIIIAREFSSLFLQLNTAGA